jgi:hypothetical protein
MSTSLATKRAIIGECLTSQDSHLTEAVKLLATIDSDSARQAIKKIYLASHKGEMARIEAGTL